MSNIMLGIQKFLNAFFDSIWLSYLQMKVAKLRFFLTAMGVIVGILSITLMGIAINGIDQGFNNSMKMIGYDLLYVEKFSWTSDGDWWRRRNRRNIDPFYAEKINKFISSYPSESELLVATPRLATMTDVSYKDRFLQGIFLQGAKTEFLDIMSIDIEQGRFFTALEEKGGRNVCVIGSEVASIFFPNQEPLGQTLKIKGNSLRIIGVIDKLGEFLGLFSWDRQIIIPIERYYSLFGNKKRFKRSTVIVKIKDEKKMEDAKLELTGMMRIARQIAPGQEDDFEINEQKAFAAQIQPIKTGISLAGIFITGLALFVGAIGIMNITFVSVKERTREIGTRMAVGARRWIILMQFLIEAVFICGAGCVAGLLLAYGISVGIAKAFPEALFSFSIDLIFIGAAISVATGIISGFAPAYQASKLHPIEALRN